MSRKKRTNIDTEQSSSCSSPVLLRLDETDNFQRKPCKNCPWRKDVAPGEFSADDFRRLANTAYDLAHQVFTCHKTTEAKPHICAGFLLRGADNNLTVRFNYGHAMQTVQDGGHPLHGNYREMAIANGVAADDPALTACRDWRAPRRGI